MDWDEATLRLVLQQTLPARTDQIAQRLAEDLIRAFPQRYAPDAKRIAQGLLQLEDLQKLHIYCLQHAVWPAPALASPRMRPVAPFDQLELPEITTSAALADWLMIPLDQLDRYVDRAGWREEHGETAVNNYFTHLSPKTSGGHRVIEAPKPRLKSFQRRILRQILSQVPVHPDSYGFVAGRDCRMAAQKHAGEALVISFDLRDFFAHVQAGRIYGLFRSLGYPAAVAHGLTGLCTVVTPTRIRDRLPFAQRQILRAPHLPQGAPTSPALANLAAFQLDRRLAGLARSLGAQYARYADDLTFSGERSIRDPLLQAVPDIIRDEGFFPNPAKTRTMAAHERQMVTGIVVNQRLNITRREFDRLKAVIHAGAWQHDPVLQAKLSGQIGWVAQLHPAKAVKLRALMART